MFLREFTGIDSPYEEPLNPEVVVETDIHSVESIISQLESHLRKHKILS